MDGMSKSTLLQEPTQGSGEDCECGWVGDAGRWRQAVGLECDGDALLFLGAGRNSTWTGLISLATIRRAPKCAPDMYVWASRGLRLIYA